jgi:putative endonuclease
MFFRKGKENVGRRGERLAEEFLKRRGFKLIRRRFRTPRWGEIDLVMQDGDVLVFVEVKTRSSAEGLFGGPLGAVNRRKRRTLKKAIQYYVLKNSLGEEPLRADVISVILESGKIEHFENVIT